MDDAVACKPVKTTCPYCGVGCGVIATPQADGSVAIVGDPDHPANFGRLCSKGAALGETLSLDDRLLEPRAYGKSVDWDAAIDLVAGAFQQSIAEHGPDSVAFYVSGQLLTEDYYVANKLMKGFIGSGNIDTNSRLCMASSVAGHRRAFGADTVPATYEDLEEADLVVLVGSNLAWCHPVLFQRLVAAKERRGAKIVVIDPRRSATCESADLHLPIASDGDVALFSGLLAWLDAHGHRDHAFVDAHTSGLDEALRAAGELGLDDIAAGTGISAEQLQAFYELWANTPRVVTAWSQGVNQSTSGTDKVNAIINCHLLTGRIGKPGAAPFSITGQPNAMGGREVGGLANMLAAHLNIEDEAHRRLVQCFWRAPVIAQKPGFKAVDLFNAVADGRIKAIWIMATNPVDSMPDADLVRGALAACPFVVVSDVIAKTDTTRLAHVLLPATAWGEKAGSVTNSERRISRQRPFLPAPGQARADWRIICDVAARMGFGAGFAFQSPAEIFAEHALLSAAANGAKGDFNIAALAHEPYDALQPTQWPTTSLTAHGRFFGDGRFFTHDQRAQFIVTPVPAMPASPRRGLTLNTGRIRDQWHTMTRTGKAARLMAHLPEPFCDINPADADRLGIMDGALVEIENEIASAILRARVTAHQPQGSVFAPMHWTDCFSARARIDALAHGDCDPVSGQPALKASRVHARPFAVRWTGFAVSARRPEADCAYWALGPVEQGWRMELAGDEPPGDWQDFAARLFAVAGDEVDWIAYSDPTGSSHRVAAFAGEGLLGVLFVSSGRLSCARSFLIDALKTDHAGDSRIRLLAGRTSGPVVDDGAPICVCFSVGEKTIVRGIASGLDTVESIGRDLKAGSNCGSCRSEIRRLLEDHHVTTAM
jgi:assimilatory nitrate reductase catalytic subunit